MTALCVFGYSALALAFTRKGEEGIIPFFIVSAMVLLLYAALWMGILYPAAMALKYGAIPAFILGAYLAWQGSAVGLARRLFPLAFAYFLAGCLLAWWWTRGLGLTHWDEFTHWGLYAKYLWLHNDLPPGWPAFYAGMDLPVMEKYPPGVTVFHYFGAVGGPYSEDRLYQAGHVLIFAALAPFVSARGYSHPAARALIILFTYVIAVSLGHRFKSLMADQFLGLYFGAAVFVYLQSARERPAALAAMGLPLGAIVLFKAAGALFSGMAAGLILLCWAVDRFFPKGPAMERAGAWLAAALVAALIPAAVGISWRYYVFHIQGYEKRNGWNAPVKDFTPKADQIIQQKSAAGDGRKKMAARYLELLLEYARGGKAIVEGGGAPAAAWLAALALLLGGAWYSAPPGSSRRRLTALLAMTLLAGAAAFLGSLLQVYITVYGSNAIPSLERYVNTFLLAAVLAGLGALLSSGAGERPVMGVLAALCALVVLQGQSLYPLSPFDLHTAHRAGHLDRAAFARAAIQGQRKVLISCDEGCGVHSYIIRYELLPLYVDVNAWNPAGAPADQAKRDYIALFDYVYTLNAKPGMLAELEALADPAPSGRIRPFLYRVIKKDRKLVKLEPVTELPPGAGDYAWGDSMARRLAASFGVDGIYHDAPGRLSPVRTKDAPPAVPLEDPILYRPCLQAAGGLSPAYLLPNQAMAGHIRSAARRAGVSFTGPVEDGYALFHSFKPAKAAGKLKSVPMESVAVSASTNSDAAPAAMDGNIGTLWSSNAPQTGVWLQFAFGVPRAVAGVDLLSTYPENSPARLAIEYSEDGKTWTLLDEVDRTEAAMRFYGARFSIIPRARLLTYRFAPVTASWLRLRQTGESVVDWHILDSWILEREKEEDGNPPIKAAPPAEWAEEGAYADQFTLAALGGKEGYPEPGPAFVSTVCATPREEGADTPPSRPVEELRTVIASPAAMPAVEAYMEREGVTAGKTSGNGYTMWKNPVHPVTLRKPLEKAKVVSIRATHNQQGVSLTDGQLTSPWRSGAAQEPGMSMVIGLNKPEQVSGIALDAGGDFLDLPRTVKVELSLDGKAYWPASEARTVHRRFLMEEGWLAGEDSALVILFGQGKAAFIRVTLVEGRNSFNWTVRDITIFGPLKTE